MLYAERHRPRGVGLAGAVHRTWAVAEKNDWQFSNPRIDTDSHTADTTEGQVTNWAILSIESEKVHRLYLPTLML